MAEFYSQIADAYNAIFPVQSAQLQLLYHLAGPAPKRILDVASASGQYAISLEEQGYELTAIDLNEAMIAKLRTENRAVDARVMNMLAISELETQFDFIYCIGNSLVHLTQVDEIGQFLSRCRECLIPNAPLLLQIVNYDRILDQEIDKLPTIVNEAAALSFERNYRRINNSNLIEFHTVLTVGDQVTENTVKLLPLRSAELIQLLLASGFTEIESYGSFKLDPFQKERSFPLIIRAQSPASQSS